MMKRTNLYDLASEARGLWANSDNFFLTQIESLGNRVIDCFSNGGTLAFAGNGGSAAESSHLAAEFTGKCVRPHNPWSAMSLGDSISSITSIGNDYSFDDIFVRTSQAYLNDKSIIIALSTSGTSRNIVNLLRDANHRNIYSVLWTSDRFTIKNNLSANEVWKVPSLSTPRIQEIHLLWGHLLAEFIENNFE